MFSALCTFILLGAALSAPNALVGTVTDPAGRPIAAARVFLEPGIGGEVREVPLSPEGRFAFEDVPQGDLGLFATAPGRGYAGQHIKVTLSEDLAAITLRLPEADTLAGRITDEGGKPLEGARITRVALLGQNRVAIPLSKLQVFGFNEPVSDANGSFIVPNLPKGGTVALKVGHPSYAVEGVNDARVGASDLRVTLYRGVFIQGEVLSRDRHVPVANADILITNAQPPYDTSMARTDQSGVFGVRLKPGVYSYRATGAGMRSSGGDKLVVTGEAPQPTGRLFVAGIGTVRGAVLDTQSGLGIAGARVHLYNNGNLSAIARTGGGGVYRFDAVEGENMVRLDSAPGYLPPNDQTAVAHVVQGGESNVPDLWVAPLPAYEVVVVDDAGAPVPGAVLSVVRPQQFGIHVADASGRASLRIGNVPTTGGILGVVEDAAGDRGAIFRLGLRPAEPSRVQVFPLSRVTGTVASARGRGLEGAIVGGVLSTGEDEPVLLWRTVSDAAGGFQFAGIVPGVPQQCMAWGQDGVEGSSAPFNLSPDEARNLGKIVLKEGTGGKSLAGKKLDWRRRPLVAGAPPAKTPDGRSLVLYCTGAQADMLIEGLAAFRDLLGARAPVCAVVVEPPYAREDAPLPVLTGSAPGSATTYLLDTEDRVVFETFGLPPLFALQ